MDNMLFWLLPGGVLPSRGLFSRRWGMHEELGGGTAGQLTPTHRRRGPDQMLSRSVYVSGAEGGRGDVQSE